jgi:hypothetical protein
MTMIDLKNLDKLSPEQRTHFQALLDTFPHLESKMVTARELNTPTKIEADKTTVNFKSPEAPKPDDNELDYSNFMPSENPIERPINKEAIPSLKIDPKNSNFFQSFETEEEKKTPEQVEAEKETREEQQVKTRMASGQPREVATFKTEGKAHPVLQKFRASLGMRSTQPPSILTLGGCDYHVKALDRTGVANAVFLAVTTTSQQALYDTKLETAIIAYAVVAIDKVPLADIFNIASEEVIPSGETVVIDKGRRADLATQAFYQELLASPNEIVESLSTFYQQEFPQLSLLGEGKVRYLCPEANCMHSRIADVNTTWYCPQHGVILASEGNLPNP